MKKACAVVGAGIVGRLLAWRLAHDGHEVTVFSDRRLDSKEGCSQAAAGMLAPFCELDHSEVEICSAGIFGISFWRQLERILGADLGFRQNGSQVVAVAEDQLQLKHLFETLKRKISAWQPQLLPASPLFAGEYLKMYQEIFSKNDTEKQSQQLLQWMVNNDSKNNTEYLTHRFQNNIFCQFEAQVDAQKALTVLTQHLSHLPNVVLRVPEEVLRVEAKKIFLKAGAAEEFEIVFDCRGFASSKSDANGVRRELRPVRGESAIVYCSEVELSRPIRMLHPRYPIYVVPRANQQFFVGATQIESGFTGNITVRSTMELLSALYCIDPAFGEAEVLEFRSGLRPAYEDNLPQLLREDSLFVLNGFFRHGYLLAPYFVEQISLMLAEGALNTNGAERKTAYLSQKGLLWK
ncbi:MAG: FAD-dependent oxidoreductase [Oligoflexales bacterium]|nr:FAD-dependent oxidoreductase [Oligoflexales bacterium]